MKHSSQPDPNTPHANKQRRNRKRRAVHGRAADLQARRQIMGFTEAHESPFHEPHQHDATLPAGQKPPLDDATARRDRRRRLVIRKSLQPQSLQMWLVLVAVVLVTGSALRKMYRIHADYRWLQAQVNQKQEQLAALREQNGLAQQRLAVLTSDKGREQLLIEHGYIPPGSRILLFPPDPEERRAAEIPKNDLSPHPPSAEDDSGSFLQQTGKTVSGWWHSLTQSGGAGQAVRKEPQPAN